MRAGFQRGILLFAGLYSYFAFAELSWLSSAGRLGPAFFPRIIGAALIALSAWSLVAEWRGPRARVAEHWRAALVLALVLDPLAAQSLRQSLTISRGLLAIFVDRPVSLAILSLTVVLLVAGMMMRRRCPTG
jgi:hypothetical protein